MSILNLSEAPDDPIERLLWLSGVQAVVDRELDEAHQSAYFEARLQGRFLAALALGLHSRKRALRWTRRENNATRRMVRWGDGLDNAHSTFRA